MKVFVDVGSHFGETIEEVVKSKYKFDKIYCIEPSKICINYLKKINDNRLIIHEVGLSNIDTTSDLYKSGELGASIYNSNLSTNLNDNTIPESVNLIKASSWFMKNIKETDTVYVKLNCEGSECVIIDDLIHNNQLKLIFNILITFDIRDFINLKDKEINTRRLLKKSQLINFCFSDDIMFGETHSKRIENWLTTFGAKDTLSFLDLEKKYYKTRSYYANKSGFFHRLENNIKLKLSYKKFPNIIKILLQNIKKIYINLYRVFF